MAWTKVPNYGLSVPTNRQQYVFMFEFTKELTAAPHLHLYSDSGGSDASSELVSGGWIAALDTTGSPPSNQNWHPSSATSGGANPNLLIGDLNYLTFNSIPSANSPIYFNLSMKVPDSPTSGTHNFYFYLWYYYAGTAPTVTLRYNSTSQVAGYPESPSNWTAITFDTELEYLQFSGNSGGGASPVDIPKPPSGGTYYVPELWINK